MLAHAAAFLKLPAFFFHDAAQLLDFFAVNGAARQHHLEAVVIARVVAARDLYAALAQRAGGKVEHGRGAHADVDDFDARFRQPARERGGQRGAGKPPVAPHGNHALALRDGMRAEGAAQRQRHAFVQGGGRGAAYVVSLEDGGGDLHGRRL